MVRVMNVGCEKELKLYCLHCSLLLPFYGYYFKQQFDNIPCLRRTILPNECKFIYLNLILHVLNCAALVNVQDRVPLLCVKMYQSHFPLKAGTVYTIFV